MSNIEEIIGPLENETYEQYYKRIEQLIDAEPDNRDLRVGYASNLLDALIDGVFRYSVKSVRNSIRSNDMFLRFERVVKMAKPPSNIFNAFLSIIHGNHSFVVDNVRLWVEGYKGRLTYNDFVFCLLIPLKDGFPGMWSEIKRILQKQDAQDGLPELCDALEVLFYSDNNEQIIDTLSALIGKHKDMNIALELLGETYYQMKMWKNAIACFTRIIMAKDYYPFFPPGALHFSLAWAYGQTKNHAEEELHYRECLAMVPEDSLTLNNLGFSLHKQKRYTEALEIFSNLVAKKSELRYSANNKVRTLIALGRYEDAVLFIHEFDGKISKELTKKAESLFHNKGAVDTPAQVDDYELDEDTPTLKIQMPVGKAEQFTNEKLLEDELTLRLERGYEVFGMKLSIYEKKGDYGRQYIIPDGRIDILATDKDDNLYVIELKKDSGYGDAYAQTLKYVDWIEKNMVAKGKRVFGIICLNNPSKKLINDTRSNPQMRLFEYSVSYSEIL